MTTSTRGSIHTVDVSELSQGVYLLQWNHEGNTLTERLIVE
jgi:hypothetical protein